MPQQYQSVMLPEVSKKEVPDMDKYTYRMYASKGGFHGVTRDPVRAAGYRPFPVCSDKLKRPNAGSIDLLNRLLSFG